MHRNLLLALTYSLAVAAAAQPTWRFHLAFEDGTGARDTLWLVYDTTATVGSGTFNHIVDYHLGEGHVDMDPTKFNVWVWNWDNDSTKTVAFPYTIFPYHNATVYASNYQYPVTIRWDLSLGSLPWLPQEGGPINGGAIYNQYFYFFNNCGGPPCGYFDMALADSVVVPQPDPNFLFPVDFTLVHDPHIGVANPRISDIKVWPSPFLGQIHVSGLAGPATVTIYSLLGVRVHTATLSHGDNILDLEGLPAGTYLLTLTTPHGHERFKIIKAR